MKDYPTSLEMPTERLSDEDKKHLDKMMRDRTMDDIQHMTNYMQNKCQEMRDHMQSEITMSDFEKIMQRNPSKEDY